MVKDVFCLPMSRYHSTHSFTTVSTAWIWYALPDNVIIYRPVMTLTEELFIPLIVLLLLL